MRRSMTLCLLLAALLGIAACGSTGITDTAEASVSRLSGYEKPPELTIVSGDTGIPALMGTFSWDCYDSDGNGVSTDACGEAPLDTIDLLTPVPVREEEPRLDLWFECWPDEISLRYWDIGNGADSVSIEDAIEVLPEDGTITAMTDSTYLYEVHAVWENRDGIGGESYYTFCTSLPPKDYYTPLPDYIYKGDDPHIAAITEYMAGGERQDEFSVQIPAFLIFRTETQEDDTVKVYGNFWVMSYHREGNLLMCEGGGENPGVITLQAEEDGSYSVQDFDRVGDGTRYTEDIDRICAGHPFLKAQYYGSTDVRQEPLRGVRLETLAEYVTANRLNIDACADFGWEPEPLFASESEE